MREDRETGGFGKRRSRKVCWFEQNKVAPDYKDVKIIGKFVTDRGKIVPRRLSGVSAKNQRLLATAVKRARHLGLLPFVAENIK